ncbi:hypothetical protein AWB68_08027 [Caballeronia choica]|uniref:Uncharacterized protein n=1 Tax=Caballeronia choica TaxID=326476 RepID=A0A158KZ85_9BURK|nr:DUF6012 family protein [Caballeronia choica]SAL86434.1 hypothetical protein AWB68_08027 [Caballeronia choica]
MLIHIRPRIFSELPTSLVDVTIEPYGAYLRGAKEVTARRPYPNKQYAVVCRNKGTKAIDGLLLSVPNAPKNFSVKTRWAVDAEMVATHHVDYQLLDKDFDCCSDNMLLWGGSYKPWPSRRPQEASTKFPMGWEPRMILDPGKVNECEQIVQIDSRGVVSSLHHVFKMPTIERDRFFSPKIREDWTRTPTEDLALKLG